MNTFQSSARSLFGLVGWLMLGLLAGCSGGGDGGSSAPGVVSVSLTDAPACGYEEVNVTVRKVRIHQSNSADDNSSGWTDITLNPPRKINLLNLNDPTQPNFALDNLGEVPLAAGHYTQLRLVLVENQGNSQPFNNSIVLSASPGTEIPLDTPSAIRTGIKLIHEFDVASGQRVDLLLDFDACKSIVQTGNGTYKLKPVVKVIPYVLNGIEGYIHLSLLPNQTNANHIVVSAQHNNGEIVRATVPNPNTGRFLLARLDPGNYDVVITGDDHATAVIANVPVVSATSITPISTSSVAFSLATSTPFRTISGAVTLTPATDDETVFVSAKQSLSPSGPTVTVQSRPTILDTTTPPGDSTYSLSLPPGAPTLATYGALPITPSSAAQAGVAGKYAVQASATGYSTQSFNKDIASASQTQDFALLP